jgi:hypothetical protein
VSALDLTCANMSDLATDFLEQAMPADEQTSFETHLVFCSDCLTYLDQIRATRRHLGELHGPALDEPERERLFEAFRARAR